MNYKKITQQYLRQWMQENNLVGDYVIHHRDDNDEVRAYNKVHYRRWGCEEDGTFVYGKYVQFLTRSEHSHHHNSGEKNPFYNKHHTDESRVKMSENHLNVSGENNPMYGKGYLVAGENNGMYGRTGENHPMYGKTHTPEAKEKNRQAHMGKMHSDETREKISATKKAAMKIVSDLWKLYKALQPNSTTTFNEFQKSLK